MRLSVVLMLLLFTCLIHAQGTENAPTKTQAEQSKCPNIPNFAAQQIAPQNQIAQTKQDAPYDARKDYLYRIYLGATIFGVFVALGGVYAIYKQTEATTQATKETARAAKATEDAATAAKINSQAIINSEHPWMFIDIKVAESRQNFGQPPEHLAFHVSFKNWGKTPAEVVSFEYHPSCARDLDEMVCPPKYQMEGRIDVHTRMVPSGEVWRDTAANFFNAADFVLPGDWQEIRQSKKWLVFWGRLQYRDLIEDSRTILKVKSGFFLHQTCFCYCWSPLLNTFLMGGYPGYNDHT